MNLNNQVGGNHYQQLRPQPIEVIKKLNLNFVSGNVVKYLARYKFKNGIEDLKKAIQYIEMGGGGMLYVPHGENRINLPKKFWELVRDWGLTHNIRKALYELSGGSFMDRAIPHIEEEIKHLESQLHTIIIDKTNKCFDEVKSLCVAKLMHNSSMRSLVADNFPILRKYHCHQDIIYVSSGDKESFQIVIDKSKPISLLSETEQEAVEELKDKS